MNDVQIYLWVLFRINDITADGTYERLLVDTFQVDDMFRKRLIDPAWERSRRFKRNGISISVPN